jgi:hypothetical protein
MKLFKRGNTRCTHCGGQFGLVRYERPLSSKQFCKAACMHEFEAKSVRPSSVPSLTSQSFSLRKSLFGVFAPVNDNGNWR